MMFFEQRWHAEWPSQDRKHKHNTHEKLYITCNKTVTRLNIQNKKATVITQWPTLYSLGTAKFRLFQTLHPTGCLKAICSMHMEQITSIAQISVTTKDTLSNIVKGNFVTVLAQCQNGSWNYIILPDMNSV